MKNNIMKLNDNWKYRIVSNGCLPKISNKLIENKWYNADVPGTIHTDLFKEGIIEDPFYSDNELRLAWIDNCDWEYQLEFNINTVDLSKEYFLLFEGLDTIAEIRFNGELLGISKNMFIEQKYGISNLLEEKNKLSVIFRSPVQHGKKLKSEIGRLQKTLESERVYLRKAQYSFGWDWGPSFPTVGIWKNVYLLEEQKIAIDDVKFDTVSISKDQADLSIQFGLIGEFSSVKKIEIDLYHEGSEQKYEIENISDSRISHSIKFNNPKLWYPNGMGEPDLYSLKISAFNETKSIIAVFEKKVGIRKIELILENGKSEKTFYFRINGKKIFAKGANWIPADSFLPRVDIDKYRTLLNLAKDANVNMVRVWGGGTYEDDQFYNICDELGLLVWQDFMFACAAYPENNDFIDSVIEEVKQNVIRLRLHPSIAIWCGNNENEMDWVKNESPLIEEMPGYKIYHSIIPQLLETLDKSRPYWPSSPFGNSLNPNSYDEGNTHQWDIWSMWKDYSEVKNDTSKFVSEFGFQGPANIDTFKKFLPKENCRIQDPIFEFHNKQIEGPERLTRFLSGHLPIVTDFEDYIYLTQLNQGFALKTCVEHWRSNGITNGSVIWQLNDSWPVTSWAIVDSEITPKLSYYFVKNIFSNSVLLINKEENSLELIVKNDYNKELKGTLNITLIQLSSLKIIEENNIEIDIAPFESRTIENKYIEKDIVMIATLLDETKSIVNRNYFINGRWKHQRMRKAEMHFDYSKIDEDKIIIEADSLALFVDLYYPEIVFEKRGVILLGGERTEISFKKLNNNLFDENKLHIRMLNQYLL